LVKHWPIKFTRAFILENQVRVGDVAIVNGTGGLVEHINFRTIVLRDIAGVVHVFPNGTVTTLSNMTNDWSAYVFEIGVAYKENTRVIDYEQFGWAPRPILDAEGNIIKPGPPFIAELVADFTVSGADAMAEALLQD